MILMKSCAGETPTDFLRQLFLFLCNPTKKSAEKPKYCQKLIFDFPDLAKSATKKISISNFIKGLLLSAVSKNRMRKISQFWRKVFEKSRKMQKKSQKIFKKITKFPFFVDFFEKWPLLL